MTRQRSFVLSMTVTATSMLLGCGGPTSLHTIHMERVDQDLAGGNRGFLLGNAPPAAARKPSREIWELAMERPTGQPQRRPRQATPPAAGDDAYEGAGNAALSTEASQGGGSAQQFYVVQKGDTLWSIARKVYGKGSQWAQVYEANRNQLPEPGRLKPGMRLQIPRGGEHYVTPTGNEK